MVIRVKTLKMTFFFLPNQHPLTLETLPDGRFYPKDWSYIVQVPHCCAPGWCEYTGDFTNEGHSWTNPISGQVHTTHPLGFTVNSDNSFFEGFYEITPIEGLTFGEGEAWCPDTNTKIHIEKTDPMSIWNPFFQLYDQPCDRNIDECHLNRIKYDFVNQSIHEIFEKNMDLFTNVYCQCCICNRCHKIHEFTCGDSIPTSDL